MLIFSVVIFVFSTLTLWLSKTSFSKLFPNYVSPSPFASKSGGSWPPQLLWERRPCHWLPIEWRVHFKLATLAYKALHTGQPPYLSELSQHYEPTRTLRSSSSFQLSVTFWLNVLILKMYEINTLLLLPLNIYLIVLKHIKSLILLKKLVFISNFNVFILMFVICFYSSLIALILHS